MLWLRISDISRAGLAFVVAHWPYFASAALFALGIFVGRMSMPARVVETKHEATASAATATEHVTEAAAVTSDNSKRKTVEHVKTTKTSAGVVRERWREIDEAIDRAARETSGSSGATVAQAETHSVATTKTVEHPAPAMRVGVMAAADLHHLSERRALGPFDFGAEIQLRVLGPFSVGGFGLTSGVVGLSLSAEF